MGDQILLTGSIYIYIYIYIFSKNQFYHMKALPLVLF